MSLIAQLEADVKEAMLARDVERRDALRLILSSLRSAEKDLQRPLSEGEELQVLQRERKKRIEAAEAFHDAGRDDRAAKEEAELAVLEDLGRVMADVMPQVAGRADGSAVGQLVREKLA